MIAPRFVYQERLIAAGAGAGTSPTIQQRRGQELARLDIIFAFDRSVLA